MSNCAVKRCCEFDAESAVAGVGGRESSRARARARPRARNVLENWTPRVVYRSESAVATVASVSSPFSVLYGFVRREHVREVAKAFNTRIICLLSQSQILLSLSRWSVSKQ